MGRGKRPEKIEPPPELKGEVRKLDLEWIVCDESLQGRTGGVKDSVVREYAAAYRTGEELPPVTVVKIGDAYVLADGWHRVAALEQNGRGTVEAEVIEGTRQTAMLIASRCNLTHGRRVTGKDKRLKFKLYVKARGFLKENGKAKSYREIAAELHGMAHWTTVAAWLKRHHRKTWERYFSGEPVGNPDFGNETPRKMTEKSFEEQASSALQQALAASKGVTDPEERRRLVIEARRVAEEIDRGGPWKEPEENDDF